MSIEKTTNILQETMILESIHLQRSVQVDLYGGGADAVGAETSLLLLNDGQDLGRLGLAGILDDLYSRGSLAPLLCAGIHAGAGRKMEYGTACRPDYQGWGKMADGYSRFVMEELVPALRRKYTDRGFKERPLRGSRWGH